MLAILRHDSSVTYSFHLSGGGRVALVCTRRFFYCSVLWKFLHLQLNMRAHSARINREWLSKKEYKLWLIPVEGGITKASCKICVKTFSLSNVGEIAVKSHALGKKHQTAVTQSQKAGSVSHYFGANSETAPGLLSSGNLEEPSTSFILDAEDTPME